MNMTFMKYANYINMKFIRILNTVSHLLLMLYPVYGKLTKILLYMYCA